MLKGFQSLSTLQRAYNDIVRIAQRHIQGMRVSKTPMELFETMENYALDTVWCLALGADDISQSPYVSEIHLTMTQFGSVVGTFSHLWYHTVHNIYYGKSSVEADPREAAIRQSIMKLTGCLVQQYLNGNDPEYAFSGRSNFLYEVSRQSGGTLENPVTPEVMALARQIFVLGHETPALALFWAIYELNRHPAVVETLRAELDRNDCSVADLNYDVLRTMPYLDAVVTEVFRLHAPYQTLPRKVIKPITILTRQQEHAVIPEGSQIFISISNLHRDPQVWGDNVEDFLPERWQDVLANTLENRCIYMPFAAGPKRCPASNYCALAVKVMLALILLQVDVELEHCKVDQMSSAIPSPTTHLKYTVRDRSI